MIRNRPPKGQGYVWLTRELLESDAWRSQGIHTRRLLDFLLLEHARHAGQHNGRLKAPYHQLHDFGVGKRYATAAIAEAEKLGLIACHRAGMRTATEYRLSWFEGHDGSPATDEWRGYRNPDLAPLPRGKIQKSAPQREGRPAPQREGRFAKSAPQREGRSPPASAPQREGPLKKLYQGGEVRSEGGPDVVVPLRRPHGSPRRATEDLTMGKLERPLPYERRAKKAGAGIVRPGERPPAGAKKWSRWKLRQHQYAGQAELFPGQDLGESQDLVWDRELRRAAGARD